MSFIPRFRNIQGDSPMDVQRDNPFPVEQVNPPPPYGYRATPLTGTATYIVKAAPGFLKRLVFNKPVATGVITLYDSGAGATGTPFAIITIPASPMPVTLEYDVTLIDGLTVVVGTAAQDLTVIWN